ncbi:polysaccharide deacetylase family protein [Ochrobactrum quorumnocens]|uniref:polysaccharide deacetylase family protein n=1 Tax=Ochrobactrum quorumnocens TaxID=271865 RepID=UPI0038549D3E
MSVQSQSHLTQTIGSQSFWPEGKGCAASISILFSDGLDALATAPDLADRNKSFSVWKYGAARGVERLCRTFEDKKLATSWFVPATLTETHEALLRDIRASGHDFASHGLTIERYDLLSPQVTLDRIRQSKTLLETCLNQEITGFRLPAGNWPHGFDRQLLEAGFEWSASLNGDDVPFLHQSRLLEIPVHIELDDRPYFQFNFTPAFPKGQSRLPAYEAVLANWKAEFDAYHRYGGCFVLQIHPEWSGTPGRISIIEDMIDYIQSHNDVWFATAPEIAQWCLQHLQPSPPQHPINVYNDYVQETAQ